MSILRPRDGDYTGRGLFLLLGWTIFGWMPFALAGALIAGAGGATMGFVASIPIGIMLYWAYLKLDPDVPPRDTPADALIETYEDYSARMKAEFPADKVHEATRDLPATGTYRRLSHERHLAHQGSARHGMATGPGAGSDIHPIEYTVLDQLRALVKQAAGEPELLFVATDALGDEMERLGMSGKELAAVRESARAVKQTIGYSADTVWKTLSWWEKLRNRRHKASWKHIHTSTLLLEAYRLVDAILEDR